jgi:hypothetical protein
MTAESYPPTLEELLATFLSTRPDYRVAPVPAAVGAECGPCPLEPVGSRDVWGNLTTPQQASVPQQNGRRAGEWMKYICDRGLALASEAGVTPPKDAQDSCDPWRRLWIRVSWYRELCRNPALTRVARQQREDARVAREAEQATAAAAAVQKAAAERAARIVYEQERREKQEALAAELLAKAAMPPTPEEIAAADRHRRWIAECAKRDTLITRHGLTPSDAEAVLAHIDSSSSYRKDTLSAIRAINAFARSNGIRFEDAEAVLRE